ncbi:MAG TPA: YraN family protein [Solirubrobacteraceae bacterium]|nr:YraN family protein [Solirubrobacteraceae bacterium]
MCTTSDSPSPQSASSGAGAHADGVRPPGDAAAPAAPHREDTRRALGQLGERLAAEHLERLGFAIVARNSRTRHGEIDLVAFDGHTLCFVEVKTRRAHRRWRLSPEEQPLAWLRTSQRARLRRLASAWLYSESRDRPTAHTIRFDAVGVIVDEADRLACLDHVEGAW